MAKKKQARAVKAGEKFDPAKVAQQALRSKELGKGHYQKARGLEQLVRQHLCPGDLLSDLEAVVAANRTSGLLPAIEELIARYKQPRVIELEDGRRVQLKDLFADGEKIFKPVGIDRFELEVLE